jgi:recombinational DNA repair ATPase RecF
MDQELKRAIYERLQADGSLGEDFSLYVIAACEGETHLNEVLGAAPRAIPEPPAPAPTAEPLGAYLSSLTVQAFRGVGPETTIEFSPGPGLTLVVGRNGSGKSSLVEALEVMLTGDSKRFQGRSKVWREGWRNLHKSHPVVVDADFLIEGKGKTRVSTSWDDGSSLEEAITKVRLDGKSENNLDSLGWRDALVALRPILSYNELSSMLDEGPSKLYDALFLALGLEDIVVAQKTLADARLSRKRALDAVRARLQEHLDDLRDASDSSSDDRIERCLAALSGKEWDLDEVERLTSPVQEATTSGIDLLTRASALEGPKEHRVAAVVNDLRGAASRLEALVGSDADRARDVIRLLEEAVSFHEDHGDGECPVCGNRNALTADWREGASAQISELKVVAKDSEEAHLAANNARSDARSLVGPLPDFLDELGGVGLDADDVIHNWRMWESTMRTNDLHAMATFVEQHAPILRKAVGTLADAARTELTKRQDVWRPIAVALSAWAADARDARDGAERIKSIKAAEDWLKSAAAEIRHERFAPISERAMATWAHLRRNSNVELGKIQLVGAGTQRRVTLDVNVDGVAGAALGVMSQGELHSLALSLFLPRARLQESPFRFVVIDDPVQSMDPSRVDGLARALEETATDRQVIVFTHDDRLSEAVRRLGVAATHIAVARKPGSVIELRQMRHPVLAYFDDAHAVIRSDGLPVDARRRVVPGLCRLALEAACMEVVRRRRLAAGDTHDAVEQALLDADTLSKRMALTLFDDAERTADVMSRLNQFGGWAGDVYKQVNKGAHLAHEGDIERFARASEILAKRLLTLS